MGRPRSQYICLRCGKQGYLENNPITNRMIAGNIPRRYRRVVHYDSVTRKRKRCYVQNIINDMKIGQSILKHQKELENMTVTEFIDECLREEQEERHIRNIIKARKENRQEFIAKKMNEFYSQNNNIKKD